MRFHISRNGTFLDGIRARSKAIVLILWVTGQLLTPLSQQAAAQTNFIASLQGQVLDQTTRDPVANGTVTIHELNLTTQTDAQGRFQWRDLSIAAETEPVTISVTADGYAEWRIEGVLLIASDTLILNVELGSETVVIVMPAPRTEPPGEYRFDDGEIALDLALDLANLPLPETILVRVYGYPYHLPNGGCDWGRTGYELQEIDFKYYVKHVLPNEWVYAWPRESLRAGAMAAKMYGWFWVEYPGTWDVRDDVCDQVYNPAVEYTSTNNAVDFTWNWRMSRADSLILPHYLDTVSRCNSYNWTDCIGQWDTYYHAIGNNGYDKLTWDEMLFRYYDPIDITAVVPPPEFVHMLRFNGNGRDDEDRLKVLVEPHVPIDVGMDFTIEWWMKADLVDNPTGACTTGAHENWRLGNIIFDRDIENTTYADYGISLAGGKIAMGVNNGAEVFTLCGNRVVADSEWHHIAVTRNTSTGELRLYVDGSLDSEGIGPAGDIQFPDGLGSATTNDRFLVIGANKYSLTDDDWFPAYNGFMDEVRFSNLIRYPNNFHRPIDPFTTDSSTLSFFHFDEGYGDTLYDTSGASGGPSDAERFYGGSTNGPEWYTSTLDPRYEVYLPAIIR